VTTEARPTSKGGEQHSRLWVILSFQAGMFLALLGAAWLFSFVHDVSWIVCGVLSLCMLLICALLLPAVLRGRRRAS
jgi:apolipoprotein N-acyltransferase